jgi:uncharacterized protein YqeY
MQTSIKHKLTNDLKQAMRNGDKAKSSVIRLLMAAIQNAEIAARHTILDDSETLSIIAKEVRKHKESITAFKQGDRNDLVAQEEAEMAILQEYLPQQISREEIMTAARQVIGEIDAQGPGDKGRVMSQLIPQLKGKADGREVNKVVTELLS